MLYLLLLSLIVNLFFLFPLLLKKRNHHNPQYLSKAISDEKLLSMVAQASITKKKKLMVFYEPTGTIYDYRQFLHPRGKEIINNFQDSYLLFGLVSYALAYNRQDILNHVIEKVNNSLDSNGNLKFALIRLDQIPFGLTLMLLDTHTSNKYTTAIKQIYDFIINRYNSDGTMLYIHGSNFQHVDSIGMYVPFLSLYSKYYNDLRSLEIIKHGIEEYQKFGVDNTTGMPAHGFNIESKIKIGSINWGRGLGWYLLGLSFIDNIENVCLDKTLQHIKFDQFPGQVSQFDSSTSIMANIYMLKKKLDNMPGSLDFIKPYISKAGNVENCSGDTYTYNRYSNTFGASELCNGLLLYLGSLLKQNENWNNHTAPAQ